MHLKFLLLLNFYLFFKDSNYYINRVDDFIDDDGIYRALQYRYTNWAQPENSTALRQKLVDVISTKKF